MTVTTNGNGHDVREQARQMFRANPGLRREDVAAHLGMSPRWVGTVKAEVKAEARNGAVTPVPVAGTNGTREVPRPARSNKPATRTSARRGKAPWPLVALVIGASLMVATVTAVVSYTHVRHLAATYGAGNLAGVYPLGVDGLVAACGGILIWDRIIGMPTSWLARVGVWFGIVGTVTANVLDAPREVIPMVLAGYPPLALAIVVDLLLRKLGDR